MASFQEISRLLLTPAVSLPASLVPVEFLPVVQLDIQFKENAIKVAHGNTITPLEAAGEFEIKIQDSKNSDGLQYYTLICLDPDAPSRANPVAGPWLHSIQTSLLSTGLPQHDVNDLALVPYTGPSPPEKTSLHRYTFLLYRQPAADLHPLSKHASPKSVSRFDRRNFDCEGFVKSNGLELVAINWFFCENQGLAKA